MFKTNNFKKHFTHNSPKLQITKYKIYTKYILSYLPIIIYYTHLFNGYEVTDNGHFMWLINTNMQANVDINTDYMLLLLEYINSQTKCIIIFTFE